MNDITQLDQHLWESLELEINRVNAMIEDDQELQPDDVKEVRRLKNAIDQHVKSFNKALTDRVKLYRQQIDERLTELNYQKIEEYVNVQKLKHQKEIDERIAKKQADFKQWVGDCKDIAPILHQTVLAPHLVTYLIHLFPNVSSGAKNKTIKEDATKVVLTHLLATIEAKLAPAMISLPMNSYTMRHLVSILKSGNVTLLDTLNDQFELDLPYLQDESVKVLLHTSDDVVAIIKGIVNSDAQSDAIIENITRVIRIWQTKSFMR